MTRPENAEQAEVQVASKELGAADEPAQNEPAQNNSAHNDSAQRDSAWRSPSDSGVAAAAAPPQQRQRAATGDGDPTTVTLPVGSPEHIRGAVREQADRQPALGRAYGFSPGVGPPIGGQSVDHDAGPNLSPSTVRVGGYTPPERVSPAVAGPAPNGSGRSVRVPRRTSLQLQRLEPWSVLKLSLVLSVAGFLVWMIAVGVLYGVLAGMGVWDQINGTYSDLTSANNSQMSTELVSGGRVFGVAMVIGLVNIVLMTALATVGSLIYNVAADLVGGIEVTLSEPD